jgi:protein-disulfide isomerase
MSRFDKVDPKDGSFRAKLGFAVVQADVGKVIPVEINGSGNAVRAAANSTVARGVICPVGLHAQGEQIDVMTDGEIVDVKAGEVTNPAAGARVRVSAAGTVEAGGAATGVDVGWFVENWRLIVRLGRSA